MLHLKDNFVHLIVKAKGESILKKKGMRAALEGRPTRVEGSSLPRDATGSVQPPHCG